MLLIVILVVCFGLAFLGLTMCRLAARSDASDALAFAEWVGASEVAKDAVLPAESSRARRHGRAEGRYRATG
jgi:hypothetical protein